MTYNVSSGTLNPTIPDTKQQKSIQHATDWAGVENLAVDHASAVLYDCQYINWDDNVVIVFYIFYACTRQVET